MRKRYAISVTLGTTLGIIGAGIVVAAMERSPGTTMAANRHTLAEALTMMAEMDENFAKGAAPKWSDDVAQMNRAGRIAAVYQAQAKEARGLAAALQTAAAVRLEK